MNFTPQVSEILNSRQKYLPNYCYKLADGQFATDFAFSRDAEVNENEMSVIFPFADGKNRDSVGDLLEVGGIRTDRHLLSDVLPRYAFSSIFQNSDGDFPFSRNFSFLVGGELFGRKQFTKESNTINGEFSITMSLTEAFWVTSSFVIFSDDWKVQDFECLSFNNSSDSWFRDLVHSCQFTIGVLSGSEELMDFPCLVVGKFSVTSILSSTSMSMPFSVLYVFCMSAPCEIFQPVIGMNSVQMPTLHSFRTWSNKCFQNKTVNTQTFTHNSYCPPSLLSNVWLQYYSLLGGCSRSLSPIGTGNCSGNGFNSSMIRNPVDLVSPGNWEPSFFIHSHSPWFESNQQYQNTYANLVDQGGI